MKFEQTRHKSLKMVEFMVLFLNLNKVFRSKMKNHYSIVKSTENCLFPTSESKNNQIKGSNNINSSISEKSIGSMEFLMIKAFYFFMKFVCENSIEIACKSTIVK